MSLFFNRLFGSGESLQQYGVLCFRGAGPRCEIATVTSRGSGRIVIPKGWPEAGLEPHEAAAREAEEEAGLVGRISDRAIGTYSYTKRLHLFASIECRVTVFAMRVTGELGRWAEMQERQRFWMSPEEVAGAVDEKGLAEIVRRFARRLETSDIA